MQGFITAVANPKGWAFFIAMAPAFINYEANLIPQMSALVIIILIIEFISLMIYATGGQALGIVLKKFIILSNCSPVNCSINSLISFLDMSTRLKI